MSGLRDEITKRLLGVARAGLRPASTKPSAASEETHVPTDPREGKQFGSYRILRRLGAGGMGHVYLALDTRLGRHVALKFLPPELLSDEESLRRLEQEARAASALNHPNILTIYEIAEFQGELFIASEFVQGITLKKAISRRTVDADMAIRIATQIASALMAAHAAGVIHRDLKPANVMVRPDGYIKVIDFGLAKIGSSGSAIGLKTTGLTLTGLVMGTVDYMSPEQARGEEVDARTDLWSLGVVLYEMLSAQRPFAGETDSHVIVAILDHAPAPMPHFVSLPTGTSRIVERALVKDRARRYQSAKDMLEDLDTIQTSSARRRLSRPIEGLPRRRFRFKYVAVLAAVLLILGLPAWWWGFGGRDRFMEPDWFRIDSVKQLTFNGRALFSAISPDGKYLAFVVGDEGGMQSLHVKQVGQPSDEMRVPRRKIDYIGLTFSPDSRTIYEVEKDQGTLWGRLFAVPLVGELPHVPILEDIDGPVAFSPTGDRFAFVRYRHQSGATESLIEVMSLEDRRRTTLWSSASATLFPRLAWSAITNQIAAVVEDPKQRSNRLELKLIQEGKHDLTLALPPWNAIGQLCWTARGRGLLLSASSQDEAKSQMQLRAIATQTGETHDLTKDLTGYRSLTSTQDDRELAAIKIDSRATLWVSYSGDFAHGESSLAEVQDRASLSWLDQNRLLLNSRRTGYPNLISFDTISERHASLTNEPFIEQNAVSIPDGKSVVFSSNRAGGFHIWRFDIQSGKYTQLSHGATYDDSPAASPDGKWVVYTSWSVNTPSLRRVAVDGGPSTPVSTEPAAYPQVSPDGQWIACQIHDLNEKRWFIALLRLDGSEPPKPLPAAHVPFRWSPSGDSLTSSIAGSNGVSNLWRIPIDGSAPSQLTRFEDQSIPAFAWSPSGDRVTCLRLAQGADVVLFKRQEPR
jgi:eukaryotic-like serine/threonine-protein kinase